MSKVKAVCTVFAALMYLSIQHDAAATQLTGSETAVMAVTVTVSEGVHGSAAGKKISLISVSRQTGTLRQCFEMYRFHLNDLFTENVRNAPAELKIESISVWCVYETESGSLDEYIAGIWTSLGRYEPKLLNPSLKYPDWLRQ